jgi:ABC-type phosphate transport system substrate-binding protein
VPLLQGVFSVTILYKEYKCSRNAPLSCDRPLQTSQEVPGAKFCLECGFPATLARNAEIKGSRGTYQVIDFLGMRGLGRLYSGIHMTDGQPVVIKEYLLPSRCFNDEETRQRKETFKRVAGVSLADGRNQNFRLIHPSEAIASSLGEGCYLIMKGVEASQTLSEYLMSNGAMDATQGREVLNQALQTLQFLHTQKLRLPSNQVQQGMAHGNLSLDSILIQVEKNQQFYIYLCDLAVWESLFEPPTVQPSKPQPQQDLAALGLVAFYLGVGGTVDRTSGKPLNPKDIEQFPNSDTHLKQFVNRLIGLNAPFENALSARKELLQLPKAGQSSSLAASKEPEEKEKGWRKPWIFLGILALLLLGGGIWYFLKRASISQKPEYGQWSSLLPHFFDVADVPIGEFPYTGEKDSTWSFILGSRPESDRTLEEIFSKPKPDITLSYQPSSEPIETVRNCKTQPCKANFAMTSFKLDGELESKPIAYDGLLVFVAHSQKNSNLPSSLQGKITLEQLRKIYTGEIKNWQELGGPNLLIKPYAPTEPEAVRQFQQKILQDDPQLIASYKVVTQPYTEKTEKTIQGIVSEFDEGRSGIISFGILSKTWNQCNAYPLAIGEIQPLLGSNGQKINPGVNLCNKGYSLDVEAFKPDKTGHYPLSYSLFVVYPKNNSLPAVGSKFAEMLTTRQGQCLIKKAGLVPLQAIPENDITTNACKSLP